MARIPIIIIIKCGVSSFYHLSSLVCRASQSRRAKCTYRTSQPASQPEMAQTRTLSDEKYNFIQINIDRRLYSLDYALFTFAAQDRQNETSSVQCTQLTYHLFKIIRVKEVIYIFILLLVCRCAACIQRMHWMGLCSRGLGKWFVRSSLCSPLLLLLILFFCVCSALVANVLCIITVDPMLLRPSCGYNGRT